MALRQSPSGPLAVLPNFVLEQPRLFEPSYAPTVSNPLSGALVLRPAGHPPGQYVVSFSPVVRVAGFTTITPSLSWSAPGVGIQNQLLTTFSPTVVGAIPYGIVSIESNGVSPILLVCSASTPIFGSPAIDLSASATRIATQ